MSRISYGDSLIQPNQVSEEMVLSWKSEEIPERQRALVRKELGGMYKGDIPPVFPALQECLRPHIFPGCSVLEIGCASGYHYHKQGISLSIFDPCAQPRAEQLERVQVLEH